MRDLDPVNPLDDNILAGGLGVCALEMDRQGAINLILNSQMGMGADPQLVADFVDQILLKGADYLDEPEQ